MKLRFQRRNFLSGKSYRDYLFPRSFSPSFLLVKAKCSMIDGMLHFAFILF